MAKHTPDGDKSFTVSLLTHVGSAVALVALVSAAFWGVGQVRGDGDPVAAPAEAPDEPARTQADPADLDPAAPDSGGASAEPTGVGTDPGEPTSTATSTEADPEPAATAELTPHGDPSPEPTAATGASDREFAPEDVSIQVLDAVLDDGGEASKRVFDELRADGYRAVARNQAVRRYAVTTVMYSPGGEAKARQVAAEYGYAEVAPKPDNLSSSVDVHVVVGADA